MIGLEIIQHAATFLPLHKELLYFPKQTIFAFHSVVSRRVISCSSDESTCMGSSLSE